MVDHLRTLFAFCAGWVLLAVPVSADELGVLTLPTEGARLSPVQDDAGLHDVRFVGKKIGWAVGDHGVVLHSDDGGRHWSLVKTPVGCSLRSVCFLTDRVGWIVGGGTVPYTRQGYGVVMMTSDGGKSWKLSETGSLPPLYYVRFFGLKNGVAVGETSSDHPTGVFITDDGGRRWRSLSGRERSGWRAADFVSPELGMVAGLRGRNLLVDSGRLLPTRLVSLRLRGLHGVKLEGDGTGWLVGDGGLALWTDSGGLVWQAPADGLPDGVADIFDFRAVEKRGPKVWLAGTPGSMIWHSPDNGRSWQPQPTGQTVPIHAVSFVSDKRGFAAGALGMLLKTDDGGQTWQAVRGAGRRVAMMAVHARPEQVSFHLLAKHSAEQGYRSMVLLPARRDIGPDGHQALDQERRLHDSILMAGGSAGRIGWRLPLAVPGLEHNSDKLLADWMRRTEGKLREVFLGDLVCQLRTWRPSIVVIDQPAPDDAVGRLLNQAMSEAVRQAADPRKFVRQLELAGLKVWDVNKVLIRLADGSTGQMHVDLHEYLPRLGRTVQATSAAAYGCLTSIPDHSATREAYRAVVDRTQDDGALSIAGRFFQGISLAPGSAARRAALPYDDADDARQRKIARRQRNFHAYAKRFLDDPRHASQIIAQLSDITSGMPDDQAALQLMQLANNYRDRSQWDLVESTFVELVERYPDEPVTLDAMRWLLQLWSGAEPAWQRARKTDVTKSGFEVDAERIRTRIQKAFHVSKIDPLERNRNDLDSGPDPLTIKQLSGMLKIDVNEGWRTGAVKNWNGQALHMASLLRKKSPAIYRSPQVRFPVASLLRRGGSVRSADRFYRKIHHAATAGLWQKTAQTEIWLNNPIGEPPRRMLTCQKTDDPPVLDGILSDACWQQADEIPLRSSATDKLLNQRHALVMFAYDSDYLYLAASIPRTAGLPADMPVTAGRKHDADLSNFDRLSVFLDIDRDYATYYAFHVDQRSQTSESCWEDTSWNPTWHVAADADETHWRIEAAIPLKALAPSAPARHEVWALGVVRVIPTVGVESWTHPAAGKPRPETFGLLRFE